SIGRIAANCEIGGLKVIGHARAAQRRILEIHTAARTFTDGGKARLQESYRKLVGITRGVVRQAEQTCADLASGKLPITGDGLPVIAAEYQLQHFLPLVKRVIAQTKVRVFGGNTHMDGKVLSLFEEHTQVI